MHGQTTLDVALVGPPGAYEFDVIHTSQAQHDSFVLSEASARVFALRFDGRKFHLLSHGCHEYTAAHLSGVFSCNGSITDTHSRELSASGSELLDVTIQETTTVSATRGNALTLRGANNGVRLVQRGAAARSQGRTVESTSRASAAPCRSP